MRCPACGLDNPATFTTCGACGRELTSACPNCRAPAAEGGRYCASCGIPLGPAPEPTTHETAGGPTERRLVSVLFADVVGFTSYAEGRDPEEVSDFLSTYFDMVRATIARYGGRVEKFIGDAVMAIWGAPTAFEDDAERAVRAGLDLLAGVTALGERVAVPDLELRAGVATGPAAVTRGLIGQGMVAGDVVNTAARLQVAADPGTLLTESATHRATNLSIAFEPAGSLALRNRREPVTAWRAVRVVAGRRGEGRTEHLEPPLVGRATELRALRERYHAVVAERAGHLVTVLGSAGTGKSRLAWELEKYADGIASEVYWHRAATPAYGQRLPYAALAEMVRQRAGDRLDMPRHERVDRLRASVARLAIGDAERRRLETALRALVGLPGAPIENREELFAAWHTFFERLAARRPTVLVFDDLQWADDALLDFIERLVELPRSAPLLVVALARPELIERRAGWARTSHGRSAIVLHPLSAAAMRRLLVAMAPELPRRLTTRVRDHAQGIPLYAVEMVRMLAERGQAVEELRLPETIHALMAARLDALDHEARSLLRDAAVIGRRFSVNALAAVSGRARAGLEDVLDRAVRAALLTREVPTTRRRAGIYRFAEWALQEVAYSTLPRRHRRQLHVAAARYLEALEDPAQIGVIATHVHAAHQADPADAQASELAAWAGRTSREAARRASRLHAPEQALAHLHDALSVARTVEERAELWEEAAAAAESAARHELAERYLRNAIRHHARRGRDAHVARLTARLGGVLLMRYRVRDAVRLLAGALTPTSETGASDAEAASLMARLARAHSLREERAAALEWSDRALTAARRHRLPGVAAESLMTMGADVAFSGRMRRGLRLMRQAISTAENAGLVVAGVRARVNLAAVLLYADPRMALQEARHGLTIARDLGLRDLVVRLASVGAGDAALDSGDWDWAATTLSEIELDDLPQPDAADLGSADALIRAWRGDDGAARRVERLAGEVEPGDRLSSAIISYRVAAIGLADGDAARASESARAAVDLLTTEGYRLAALSLGWSIIARAATWSGDADTLRAALAALDAQRLDSRWWEATRATMLAGMAALDGDAQLAGRRYGAAVRRWSALGLPLRVALTRMDQACSRCGEVARAREQARSIFAGLGADRFVATLDRS